MKRNGSEIVVYLLQQQGIELVAGIPGSANLPLYEMLYDSPIRHILVRHEQAAGFLAQGMARSTGNAAVCLATSGPGMTNLLTAIADAKLDSVPIVAITGQVPTSLMGTDAFQELDTQSLTQSITKHYFFARTATDLLFMLPEAFRLATSGRPGPVVLDIPKDVLQQSCEFDRWPVMPGGNANRRNVTLQQFGNVTRENAMLPQRSREAQPRRPKETLPPIPQESLLQVAEEIHRAERPIILIGGGIGESDSGKALLRCSERFRIPVASTLRGLGCFPPDHPNYLGMVGMHGGTATNRLMEEADLILALGVRFGDRSTGKKETFCRRARVIHVDIDPTELGKIQKGTHYIHSDLNRFFEQIEPLVEPRIRENWFHTIAAYKKSIRHSTGKTNDFFHPVSLISFVANNLPSGTIVTTDVGQHQMWVAMHYPFERPRQFLTSAGLGTMGFGVPAAIGAALTHPGEKVVCIAGDGSILMNIQELATLAECEANVTILLFNNEGLGLVRQQQRLFYGNKLAASEFNGYTDFVGIARSFGLNAVDLGCCEDPGTALTNALRYRGPILVNIPIESSLNVFPMVKPGSSNLQVIDAIPEQVCASDRCKMSNLSPEIQAFR